MYIPRHERKIIERLLHGDRLIKTKGRNRLGEPEIVYSYANGGVAPKISVEHAIAAGFIEPVGDALMAGDSQTWVIGIEGMKMLAGPLAR